MAVFNITNGRSDNTPIPTYTLAEINALPTPYLNQRAWMNDGDINEVSGEPPVGGGSTVIQVYFDGIIWRIT
tara:strand:- start:13 stop:228 length:216 start_codon:yes stop_codon:yes gene_type:complete